MSRVLAAAAVVCATFFAACGGGETTTVIREAPAETIERTTTVEEPAPQPEPKPARREPSGDPPNVLGLPLPAARRQLKQSGYKTAAKNTDTTFGIIDPSNYTICNQGKPRGDLVVVLAQKYGC